MQGVGVELVAFVAVGRFAGNRVVVRLVRRDDPAVRPEARILEQSIVVAGVVDRGGNQDRRATVVVESRLETEVLDDVGDDSLLRSPALISSFIVAQRWRNTAFWKLFRPLVFCSNHWSMRLARSGAAERRALRI